MGMGDALISVLLVAYSKLSLLFRGGRREEVKGTWEKAEELLGGNFY